VPQLGRGASSPLAAARAITPAPPAADADGKRDRDRPRAASVPAGAERLAHPNTMAVLAGKLDM
jgi:hypothetical protein